MWHTDLLNLFVSRRLENVLTTCSQRLLSGSHWLKTDVKCRRERQAKGKEQGWCVAIETEDKLMLPKAKQQLRELMRHYNDNTLADGTVSV